jgi:4-amino-4-deoxychorismate lyase
VSSVQSRLQPHSFASLTPPPFQPWLGHFESLRVIQGRVLFLEEHYRSFCQAAADLGLDAPLDYRPTADFLPPLDGRWRWVHQTTGTHEFFQEETAAVPATFTLSLAPQRLGSANWDARYKTLSYLTHWQARKSVNTDEALLLNEHGHLCSGAMSNLFWVSKGQLHTPALAAGCRNGVVRQWVMQQVPALEVHSKMETLLAAEEIFLTNSFIGIKPVTRWAETTLAVGDLTEKLSSAYQQRIG